MFYPRAGFHSLREPFDKKSFWGWFHPIFTRLVTGGSPCQLHKSINFLRNCVRKLCYQTQLDTLNYSQKFRQPRPGLWSIVLYDANLLYELMMSRLFTMESLSLIGDLATVAKIYPWTSSNYAPWAQRSLKPNFLSNAWKSWMEMSSKSSKKKSDPFKIQFLLGQNLCQILSMPYNLKTMFMWKQPNQTLIPLASMHELGLLWNYE